MSRVAQFYGQAAHSTAPNPYHVQKGPRRRLLVKR